MRGINTDNDYFKYTLTFICSEHTKCLALAKLKNEVPWIELETLPDGTVVATGNKIKTLQYGNRLRKQLKRSCVLCKKKKQNGR